MYTTYLKLGVGLGGYSGKGKPPMFGDFEAQRHWLELTCNLPLSKWYYYNPEHWLIDYPPLTAYHSWVFGSLIKSIEPSYVELDTSIGIETKKLTFLMRLSSLLTDVVFVCIVVVYFSQKEISHNTNRNHSILLTLSNPCFILIDHGHFQYNSLMLGLSLICIYFLLIEPKTSSQKLSYYLLGSIAYCMAFNFKQMALFYALPVFAYLLGKCFYHKSIKLFLLLGLTVLLTNLIIWAPFIITKTYNQLLYRIFPVSRGLFEDKVASFWCASNTIIKYRNLFTLKTLLNLSMIATLISSIPSLVMLFIKQDHFLYSMAYVSMCFFLFGFQVHEKSILLPALPIVLLQNKESQLLEMFTNFSTFSMIPLLKKDDQGFNSVIILVLYNIILKDNPKSSSYYSKLCKWVLYVMATLVLIANLFIDAPRRYPDLYVVLNVCLSASVFHLCALYLLYKQYKLTFETKNIKTQ